MWLDDDQDKVVAWLRARHSVCSQCGTTEADWVDPQTRRLRDDPKWEATTYRCHGCAEVQRAYAEIPDRATGVRVVLVPAGDHDEDGEEVD